MDQHCKVLEITDLRVVLDPELTFKNHYASVIAKANRQLEFISKVAKDFTDPYYLKSLYCALVRPILLLFGRRMIFPDTEDWKGTTEVHPSSSSSFAVAWSVESSGIFCSLPIAWNRHPTENALSSASDVCGQVAKEWSRLSWSSLHDEHPCYSATSPATLITVGQVSPNNIMVLMIRYLRWYEHSRWLRIFLNSKNRRKALKISLIVRSYCKCYCV